MSAEHGFQDWLKARKDGKKKDAVQMVECGCCDHHHRADWWGDCRDDSQRFIEQDDGIWISCADLNTNSI